MEVAILRSGKINFKLQTVTRDKESDYTIMIGPTLSLTRSFNFVKIHIPSIGAPLYIMQILIDMEGEIQSNTIIVGTSLPHFKQLMYHPDTKPVRKHWI